jgi:hypothetical protein
MTIAVAMPAYGRKFNAKGALLDVAREIIHDAVAIGITANPEYPRIFIYVFVLSPASQHIQQGIANIPPRGTLQTKMSGAAI